MTDVRPNAHSDGGYDGGERGEPVPSLASGIKVGQFVNELLKPGIELIEAAR
jgi:hypothetical protein